ncbi:MAG: class I adenylate-forming enzyme family protein [Spirochaeta sp.]|jgi:long-chain acyl-CoA synthetase|nr:class I adenylate-forming enzyme family protein [Spirochaeta sp.]
MSELVQRLGEAVAAWGGHPNLLEVDGTGSHVPVSAPVLSRRIGDSGRLVAAGGIRRDDVVALFLENSVDFIALVIALMQAGAIPVFAKLEYRRNELTTIFRDIDPDAVITEQTFLPTLRPFIPGRGIITRNNGEFSVPQPVSRHHAAPGLSDEIASINCTYRGYGDLLGSMATAEQYLLGARILQDGLQGEPGEKMLYPLPMSHIFTLIGCLLVPLFYGMTGVIARTIHPRVLFSAIENLDIQHVTAVPEIYRLLSRSLRPSHNVSSLKTCVSGGSLLGSDEYEELRTTLKVDVLHGYGLTEFTPVSRNVRGHARAGTVGPVCDGLEVRIDAATDDGRGEILVRSDALCAGYYNRPHTTRRVFRDGWFHTGDMGYFDGDHLVFHREIKLTCKVNGVMVDREEIRKTILAASSAVDAEINVDGNLISALLELPENVDIEEEQMRLKAVLQHQLAPYKIPRRLEQRR